MEKPKHTKGPWEVDHNYGTTECAVYKNGFIASVQMPFISTENGAKKVSALEEEAECPNGEANLNIIKASPTMFDALELIIAKIPLLEELDDASDIWYEFEMCKQAIALAKGKA